MHKTASYQSFIDTIDAACEQFAGQSCLQFGDQSYSYREVQQQSIRVASALQAAGVQKGMHCAVYSENSAWAVIVTLGILRAGAIWLPVNSRNTQAANVAALSQLGCHALFYQRQFQSAAYDLATSGAVVPTLVCLDTSPNNSANDLSKIAAKANQPSSSDASGPVDSVNYQVANLATWLDAAPKIAAPVLRRPTDILAIPMTGGTTGVPKGVLLSDRNFCALSEGLCSELAESAGGRTPVYLCAVPLTHVGGRIVLCGLAMGTRFIIHERFDAQEFLSTIERERVSHLFLPPTAIYKLLQQPNLAEYDYASLRGFSYGAAPMGVNQLRRALEVFGPVMRGLFGQTECPMLISALTQADHFVDGEVAPEQRLRSVGRATEASELAILDGSGNVLELNQRGEIGVKGAMVCEGYYNDTEEIARIRLSGWHLTGDIGYLDAEGFLFIVDRKKDLIISGGFNVYSAEVEFVLSTMPGIAEVAVVGLPDDIWGEVVAAFIVPAKSGAFNEAELLNAARETLGSVCAPKRVVVVESLPRTTIGKVNKKVLRLRWGA